MSDDTALTRRFNIIRPPFKLEPDFVRAEIADHLAHSLDAHYRTPPPDGQTARSHRP